MSHGEAAIFHVLMTSEIDPGWFLLVGIGLSKVTALFVWVRVYRARRSITQISKINAGRKRKPACLLVVLLIEGRVVRT